jgi:hypothetical protein
MAHLSTGDAVFINEENKGVMLPHAPSVVIDPRHHGADEMDTWIHETLHVSINKMTEAEVRRVAADITTVLWKAGYRRKT